MNRFRHVIDKNTGAFMSRHHEGEWVSWDEAQKRIDEYELLIDRAIAHFDGWQSRREETESIDDLIADMRKERGE